MISYEEIKRLIRFKEKDNNEIRFSDYEIKMAVNECIRYLNNSFALQNSDFLEKAKHFNEAEMNAEVIKANLDLPEEEQLPLYNFKDEGIELPEDYITIVSVMRMADGYMMFPVESIKKPLESQYKIVGGKLYSGTPAFTLLYKAAIAEVKESTDGIELPFVFKDVLVKLTCMILNNAETDVMMKAVDDAVRAIVPRRRYTNARIKMPFRV
jgi:hypothetical protein